jgi:hypothetical protein
MLVNLITCGLVLAPGRRMPFEPFNRREFITLLGGAAAWPLAARAQQGATNKRLPIVRWLVTGSPTSHRHSLAALQAGLTEAGYVEPQYQDRVSVG